MREGFNLARRIRMIASRAVVTLVNDALKVQGVQLNVLANEVAEAQRFQEYGFTSVPLAGAEAIVLSIGGIRSHAVVIAVDDGRHRPQNLQAGEVEIYTDEGDYIKFERGNKIEVVSTGEVDVTAPNVKITASTKATIDSPELHCTGKITAEDDVTSGGDMLADGNVKAGEIGLIEHVHPGVTVGGEVTGPAEEA
ncbi:MAG: phage baseplate assembly protein V [Bradyrhizobium sp.]